MAATSAPAAEDKNPFAPAILVQAKAIRVKPDRDRVWSLVAFQIEHVYSGDAKLKGTAFNGSFMLERGGFRADIQHDLEPPVKEGEEGIWYLMPSDEDGILRPIVYNDGTRRESGLSGWSLAIPVPARKIIGGQYISFFGSTNNIHYPSALKWARVVERVYKAARAERLKMLREYIFSDNPYVAAWALRILAEYKPSDLIPYLEKLAGDPKLSVGAQVTIDAILSDLNRKKWAASKKRAALLEHWVSGDIIETHDVLMIAARIKDALEIRGNDEGTFYRQLDWDVWLPLMEKWVVEQHLAPAFEGRLYDLYRSVDHRLHPAGESIFSYSINLLKTSKDVETQRFAAQWFVHLKLTDKQVSIIKELKDKSTNRQIRALLKESIKD
jgi:hypothetical protein